MAKQKKSTFERLSSGCDESAAAEGSSAAAGWQRSRPDDCPFECRRD